MPNGDSKPSSDSRVATRCPLFVEVQVRDRTGVYFHRARNISSGGLFIDAPVPLDEGTEITLHFRLPGGMNIDVAAQVVWTTKMVGVPVPYPGMGVTFKELDERAQEAIQEYVAAFAAGNEA